MRSCQSDAVDSLRLRGVEGVGANAVDGDDDDEEVATAGSGADAADGNGADADADDDDDPFLASLLRINADLPRVLALLRGASDSLVSTCVAPSRMQLRGIQSNWEQTLRTVAHDKAKAATREKAKEATAEKQSLALAAIVAAV